jgi:hypothetical protein
MLHKILGAIIGTIIVLAKKTFGKKSFFAVDSAYNYFYHRRNRTWENERAIEIPLIWKVIETKTGKSILEVGNVLSRYFRFHHIVVDKYEKGKAVQNIDIVDYSPNQRFDFIVSISTIEHIGFDEQPKDPEKLLRAIEHLKKLLKPGGEMHVTVPVGYNPFLDQYFDKKKIAFPEIHFFKRISEDNRWAEVTWEQVKSVGYYKGKTWHANGLAYLILKAPK